MKNTKKLLVALCVFVVCFATVFSIAVTAIDEVTTIVSGTDTSIDEYAKMKITASHGFEDGTIKVISKTSVANGSVIPTNARVHVQNNNGIRPGAKPVYGNEQSLRYFVIDYDTNPTGLHWYVQPVFSALDDVEKTPVNGFVAEFDIAFLTPIEILQEQKVDENGELVWEISSYDSDGNPIYKQAVDENGELLWETDGVDADGNPIYKYVYDEKGNLLYVQDFDKNGNLLWETEGVDADGNPIYKQATDESGNPLWETNDNGEFVLDENGEKIPVRVPKMVPKRVPVYVPVMQNAQEPLLTDEYKRDYEGNIVYKVKEYVQATDEDGNPLWEKDETGADMPIMVPVYELDENGERIPEYQEVLDENGEVVMTDKVVLKEWKGLSTDFEIAMNNSEANADGYISLISFTNTSKKDGMLIKKISNNGVKQPDVTLNIDEWYHITIQYDAKSLLTYVYIGRDDSVFEFDVDGDGEKEKYYGRLLIAKKKTMGIDTNINEEVPVYPCRLRMGSKSTTGVVGFDNFLGYQGTTIHDPTLINNKTSYEKYLYLADILASANEYETEKDSDGNTVYQLVYDADGNPLRVPVYEYVTDENGNIVYEQAVDAEGDPIYEVDADGDLIYDAEGKPIPVYKLDEKGNKIPVYKLDENGDKIQAYGEGANGEKIPLYENVYRLDTLGNKVPVYKTDANGNKILVKKGASAVYRYQSFNLLANDLELRGVYTGENYGGEPTYEELQALDEAIRIYELYAIDKRDNTGSTDEFFSCYYEMVAEARVENAAIYLSYAISAKNENRTLEKYADRVAKISKAKEFYDNNASLMERDGNADYEQAVAILAELEAIVKGDEAAYNFVRAMDIFNNSVAYGAIASRIRAHYENAAYYYPNISTDYNDPDTNLDSGDAERLAAAVEAFLAASDIVSDSELEYNAARFIGMVSVMQKKSTGTWSQDGEDVKELWLRAFDLLYEGRYDSSSEEFAVAMVIYNSAYSYFWNEMQKEHIALISAKLDSYNESGIAYIDRAGICTYVDRYIELNAKYLDLTSVEITRELTRNESYKLQLDQIVGDYKTLLVENAPKFMRVVKMTKHYSTYEDLKPLYDEATEYYYMMNIEGEGIEECIADYEELRTLINTIERDSKAYIDIVKGNLTDTDGNKIFKPMSQITNKQELYASLKEAYVCLENLDITYPGAREAKAIYDAKYQEYNTRTVTANNEVANGESVVSAVRGNWDFSTVVVFVKKLINKKG